MAVKHQTLLLALLLFVVYCCVKAAAAPTPAPTPTPPTEDPEEEEGEAPEPGVTPKDEVWTWCVEDADDKPTCDEMTKILDNLDPESEHTHNCIVGDGDEDCMKKVQAGDAKFVVLDGGEIWEANQQYGLIPVRTEQSLLEGKYYGVGIVKKGKCPGSLNDLKGKKSCHTGYGRSSGWVLPVTYFINNKIMPLVKTGPQLNDIESVKAFFSASCAANSDPAKSICTACNTKTACSEADKYYDYGGAFRGLVEGACDVAFTKHTIVAQYAVGGTTAQDDWTGLQDSTNYQILCPSKYNGKDVCTDASNYKVCNFGEAPGHAIMVSPSFPAYELNEFQNLMDAANSDPTFNNLFFSGNNIKGNIFAADASKTLNYSGTTQALLGSLYPRIQALETINEGASLGASGSNSGSKSTVSSLIVSIFAGLLYVLVQ